MLNRLKNLSIPHRLYAAFAVQVLLLVAASLTACIGRPPAAERDSSEPPTSIEGAQATLQLSVVSQSGSQVEVELSYHRRAEQMGPRIVEALLEVSPDLRFVGSRPGKRNLANA